MRPQLPQHHPCRPRLRLSKATRPTFANRVGWECAVGIPIAVILIGIASATLWELQFRVLASAEVTLGRQNFRLQLKEDGDWLNGCAQLRWQGVHSAFGRARPSTDSRSSAGAIDKTRSAQCPAGCRRSAAQSAVRARTSHDLLRRKSLFPAKKGSAGRRRLNLALPAGASSAISTPRATVICGNPATA